MNRCGILDFESRCNDADDDAVDDRPARSGDEEFALIGRICV
jgi:hypothetical protein